MLLAAAVATILLSTFLHRRWRIYDEVAESKQEFICTIALAHAPDIAHNEFGIFTHEHCVLKQEATLCENLFQSSNK